MYMPPSTPSTLQCRANLADAANAACCCPQAASASAVTAAIVAANRRNRCQSAANASPTEPACCRWLSCCGAGSPAAAQLLAGRSCRRRNGSGRVLEQRGGNPQKGGTPSCLDAGSCRGGAVIRGRGIRLCRLGGHVPQHGAAVCNALCIAFTELIACACTADAQPYRGGRRLLSGQNTHNVANDQLKAFDSCP